MFPELSYADRCMYWARENGYTGPLGPDGMPVKGGPLDPAAQNGTAPGTPADSGPAPDGGTGADGGPAA
jgi:hypothetical protein